MLPMRAARTSFPTSSDSPHRLTFIACFLLLLGRPLAAQQTVLPLWPTVTPEPAQTADAELDVTKPTDAFISGHRTARLTNVTRPTLTVYAPALRANIGAAALVFPGGAYRQLAWDGEGLDTCRWLNSVGMTCLLVKYRVPETGHYPENPADLEDAQQAMRLARQHAGEWHLDPGKIGVVGFSAGGNLAVLLGTHPDDRHVESTPASAEADTRLDARPNFAVLVYPAYLIQQTDPKQLEPVYTPNQFTPPTFLIQAENDKGYGRNAPVYFQALAAANVPAELHMYSTGGHGFGLHPVGRPEEHWTQVASAWLRSIKVLPPLPPPGSTALNGSTFGGPNGPAPPPCPEPAQMQPGKTPSNTQTTDPACW